jgi:hypothetical protein
MGFEPMSFSMASGLQLLPPAAVGCVLPPDSGAACIATGAASCPLLEDAARGMPSDEIGGAARSQPTTTEAKRKDRTMKLTTITHVFEVTITAKPANNRTRVLGLKSASNSALFSRDWEIIREATAKADAAHERQRMDRAVEELAAELEAKRAREAKRNRPIQIKTFEIE